MNKAHRLRRQLLTLHRWTGLFSAILVLILCITGIALEHTSEWQLDQRYVKSAQLVKLYGIQVNESIHFKTNEHTISQNEHALFLDGQHIGSIPSLLCGATRTQTTIAICHQNGILLFDQTGKALESLTPNLNLPEPILGFSTSQPLILLGETKYWQMDAQWLSWTEVTPTTEPVPQSPSTASVNINQSIEEYALGNILTWERIMLDLHAGRFMGRVGPYLMDLTALALIYLACSGLWSWWQKGRR